MLAVSFHTWENSDRQREILASLDQQMVQVWQAILPRDEMKLALLAEELSLDEQRRAQQIKHPETRRQFIFARSWLRKVLGASLDLPPADLVFAVQPRGKPFLKLPPQNCDLRFNLSHSGNLVVLALTHGREVGIDIELIKPLENLTELAARVFSPAKLAGWQTLPAARQPAAFFSNWTHKEAWLKCIGQGLIDDLSAIEIIAEDNTNPLLLHPPPVVTPQKDWIIRDLPLPRDYAGALVCQLD